MVTAGFNTAGGRRRRCLKTELDGEKWSVTYAAVGVTRGMSSQVSHNYQNLPKNYRYTNLAFLHVIHDLVQPRRMMEVVVTAGAISQCKAPVKSTNQQPAFFAGRMPLLLPNQQCQSTEGTTSSNERYTNTTTPH